MDRQLGQVHTGMRPRDPRSPLLRTKVREYCETAPLTRYRLLTNRQRCHTPRSSYSPRLIAHSLFWDVLESCLRKNYNFKSSSVSKAIHNKITYCTDISFFNHFLKSLKFKCLLFAGNPLHKRAALYNIFNRAFWFTRIYCQKTGA